MRHKRQGWREGGFTQANDRKRAKVVMRECTRTCPEFPKVEPQNSMLQNGENPWDTILFGHGAIILATRSRQSSSNFRSENNKKIQVHIIRDDILPSVIASSAYKKIKHLHSRWSLTWTFHGYKWVMMETALQPSIASNLYTACKMDAPLQQFECWQCLLHLRELQKLYVERTTSYCECFANLPWMQWGARTSNFGKWMSTIRVSLAHPLWSWRTYFGKGVPGALHDGKQSAN